MDEFGHRSGEGFLCGRKGGILLCGWRSVVPHCGHVITASFVRLSNVVSGSSLIVPHSGHSYPSCGGVSDVESGMDDAVTRLGIWEVKGGYQS